MGRYLKAARERAETIRYLHAHSRLNALNQAQFQYNEMSDLAHKAGRSEKGSGDATVILELMRSSRELIEEIRQRESANSDNLPFS